MITISVDRDSVCMGDDMENHQMFIEIDENISLEELFRTVIVKGYIPHVHGNDVVWALMHKNEELLSYITIEDEILSVFIDCMPKVIGRICSHDQVYLKYFSSRIKRAEHIFKKFNGEKFHIWHEGYMEEYKSYQVTLKQEGQWLSDIKNKN
jgi:hypothetical protein